MLKQHIKDISYILVARCLQMFQALPPDKQHRIYCWESDQQKHQTFQLFTFEGFCVHTFTMPLEENSAFYVQIIIIFWNASLQSRFLFSGNGLTPA